MTTQLNNPVNQREHILGIKTAPLQLLEYGDYQCPSCGESYTVVKEIISELPGKVVFIFRNFPLTDIHPDAFNAALAAEAAGLQNHFWEMYDLLFQNQENLEDDDLFRYASQLNLDTSRFEQDMQSQVLSSKIETDIEGGLRNGVNGTPTFYVNGEKYDEDWEDGRLMQYLKTLI
jgi:protein-disulfide isomerase